MTPPAASLLPLRILSLLLLVSTFSTVHAQILVRRIDLHTPLDEGLFEVVELEGIERISEPFEFTIVARAAKPGIDIERILGAPIAMYILSGDGQERRIHAICSGIYEETDPVVGLRYRITLVPHVWLLSQNRRMRFFRELSAGDIIRMVLQQNGINDYRLELTQSYPTLEMVTQFGESDLDFLQRLAARHGIYYYFEFGGSRTSIIFTDQPLTHPQLPSGSTVVLDPEPDEPTRAVIHEFAFGHQLGTRRWTVNDYNYLQSSVQLGASADTVDATTITASLESYFFPGRYRIRPEGQTLAMMLAEADYAQRSSVLGAGTSAQFAAGHRFTLEGHPLKPRDTSYLITAVRHRIVTDEKESHLAYTNDFTCIPATIPYRPRPIEPPAPAGPMTAVVISIIPSDLQTPTRIVVRFHWDRTGSETVALRPVTPPAPPGQATAFPQIGDEVLVGFVNGDPDQPVVLGRLVNAATINPAPGNSAIAPQGWVVYP